MFKRKPRIPMVYSKFNLEYLKQKGFILKKTRGNCAIYSDGSCIVELRLL